MKTPDVNDQRLIKIYQSTAVEWVIRMLFVHAQCQKEKRKGIALSNIICQERAIKM